MKNKKMSLRSSLIAAALLLSGTALAGAAETVTEQLSPETRQLLVEEMQLLASAMGPLHTAVVTGDHHSLAEQALRIRDSFVLKKKLNAAQKQEISRLPRNFLDADRGFHELADRLADAGTQQKPELERFYFEEMTRACQGCHQEFAGGQFRGLAGDSEHEMHAHEH